MAQFTDIFLVRPNERKQLAYFFVLFILLGVGLALGRGSADAMFFKRYGIENLPMMYAVVSIGLAGASLVYAAYADRVPSEKFFYTLFAGLISLIFLSWYAITREITEYVYPIYFMVFEIGSELLPLHAMLYISQNFETLQSKRLTPIIFAGAQVGRIIGGLMLAAIAPVIGVQNVLLIWVGVAVVSMVMLWRHHQKNGISPYYRRIRRGGNLIKQSIEQVMQGIRFSRQSNLIRASFLSLFFLVLSFYILNYAVNRIYTEHFVTEASLSRFFGLLTAATSVLALVIQLFVTSRLIDRLGVKRVNLIYPVTSLVSYIGLLVSFVLPAAILASLNKDAIMPAVRNPVRSLFFNVLPDYMQGRARALSLALVMPAALALAGGILIYMQRMDHPPLFLSVGLIATVLYFVSNLRMNRAYVATLMATLRERVFIPGRDLGRAISGARGTRLYEELVQGVQHPNDNLSLAYARMLLEGYPDAAPPELVKRIQKSDNAMRDKLAKLLVDQNLPVLREYFGSIPEDADDHLRSTILTILFKARDPSVRRYVADCLNSPNARLRATGIYGVYCYKKQQHMERVRQTQTAMLKEDNVSSNLAALELLRRNPGKEFYIDLMRLLDHRQERVQQAALAALQQYPADEYPGLAVTLSGLYKSFNHKVRAGCVSCYRLLNDADRRRLTLKALEDSHPLVRRSALQVLLAAGSDIKEAAIPWLLENVGTPRAEQALLESLLYEPLSRTLFEHIAMEKARYAQDLQHAALVLASDSAQQETTGSRLMSIVLAERVQQVINVCLVALRNSENTEEVAIIQAGLNSGDSRQVANAREALYHLRHNRIAVIIDDLLKSNRESDLQQHSERTSFKTKAEILNWCAGLPDPWISECAHYATREAG